MSDKEPQPRFSAAEDELLIELVAELPILYDAKLKEYKNSGLKDTKWKEIGEAINKTANQCKTRWRSIRDHYKKLKKAGKLPTGTAAQKKNRKTYFKHLRFLDRVETERESTTNVEDIDITDDNDNHSNDSGDDIHFEANSDREKGNNSQALQPDSDQGNESASIIYSASSSNMVSPLQSSIPALGTMKKIQGNEKGHTPHTNTCLTPNSKRQTTKGNDKLLAFLDRQKKERTIRINTLETSLKDQPVVDEIDLFFKSMAASVKKFPAHSKISAKMKISQIVFEEESRLSASQDSSSSMTTFNYSSPEFHLTASEPASPRLLSSAISNFSNYQSSTSETIPMPTPSPNEPELDSDLSLTPYWHSYKDTNKL